MTDGDCTTCGHVRIAHHDLPHMREKCARGDCACPGYTTDPPHTVEDTAAGMSDDHAICNPAGSCCTPKVSDDAIFTAAADAIERRAWAYMLNRTEVEALAEDVLVATRSLIEDRAEADLRERLAAAIAEVANFEPGCAEDVGYYDGLMAAARIVRERP